jgi:hydroxyacylglutathione hydrolase
VYNDAGDNDPKANPTMSNLLPGWIRFWQRPFPSANTILLQTEKPILIDSGYGSDAAATINWLHQFSTPPATLYWLINTHFHTDHVGGNHQLQTNYNVPIAAHYWEGEMLNQGDKEACTSNYLDQSIAPYHVDRMLHNGEWIDYGNGEMQVIHTPGHSLGHISLYFPHEKMLISGDALQSNDVGWLNPFREGAGCLHRAILTLKRLAQLDLRLVVPGHGAIITDIPAAIAWSLKKYERWRSDPEKSGWHACKRILAYKLMITNGIPKGNIVDYLFTCAWLHDFSQHVFKLSPDVFIQHLLDEMLRSGAAQWQGDLLVASTPYTRPDKAWTEKELRPYSQPY